MATRSQPHRSSGTAINAATIVAGLKVAIETAGPVYLPDRVHAVRIALKKLRYAIELAEQLDDLVIGIAMIDRDVVARAVAHRAPRDRNALPREQVARPM